MFNAHQLVRLLGGKEIMITHVTEVLMDEHFNNVNCQYVIGRTRNNENILTRYHWRVDNPAGAQEVVAHRTILTPELNRNHKQIIKNIEARMNGA